MIITIRFRDAKECVLIATDVMARGIDIPNVDHVVHYQIPRNSEVSILYHYHTIRRWPELTIRASRSTSTVAVVQLVLSAVVLHYCSSIHLNVIIIRAFVRRSKESVRLVCQIWSVRGCGINLLLVDDLKEFPVDRSYFTAIKKRVSLATRINTKLHAKDKVRIPDVV